MALTHWTFLYVAPGLPQDGDIREVATPTSTTVLAGFPSTTVAVDTCMQTGLGGALDRTELIELCGAFGHEHLLALREARPAVPIGLVTYAGAMTDQLHDLFG